MDDTRPNTDIYDDFMPEIPTYTRLNGPLINGLVGTTKAVKRAAYLKGECMYSIYKTRSSLRFQGDGQSAELRAARLALLERLLQQMRASWWVNKGRIHNVKRLFDRIESQGGAKTFEQRVANLNTFCNN